MIMIHQFQEVAAATTYTAIDESIHSLDLGELGRQTAITPTLKTHLQQLAKLYLALEPLLAAIVTLPILPQPWRAALGLFVGSLDAVVWSVQADPDFKAGKDL